MSFQQATSQGNPFLPGKELRQERLLFPMIQVQCSNQGLPLPELGSSNAHTRKLPGRTCKTHPSSNVRADAQDPIAHFVALLLSFGSNVAQRKRCAKCLSDSNLGPQAGRWVSNLRLCPRVQP